MQTAEAFIIEHKQMVHGLAVRLRRELSLHGDLDDLVAFGFGGLLEAQYRFDPARGVRFQTFAYHRVRGAMLDGVRKMAHLPRRAHERLRESAEIPPTAVPKAAATPLDKVFARISAGLTAAGPLHGSFGEESPEQKLIKNESITCLLGALTRLSERQRVVVRGYYFEGRSLEDIARQLGISKSWASRLHTGALQELRDALEC
jgi:RNA polymerase sigma factor for flagellar operon FliA